MRPFRQIRGRHAVQRRSGPVSQVEREPTPWAHTAIADAGWAEPSADGRFPDDDTWSSPAADSGSDAGADPGTAANDTGANDAGANDTVAGLRARVAALQSALDQQTADLVTAQRDLEKERDEARADERQRVLVAVRALRRLAATATTESAAREFARVEAVVALLDRPGAAGRPVPALPTQRAQDPRPLGHPTPARIHSPISR
jgi:hypothetical protein